MAEWTLIAELWGAKNVNVEDTPCAAGQDWFNRACSTFPLPWYALGRMGGTSAFPWATWATAMSITATVATNLVTFRNEYAAILSPPTRPSHSFWVQALELGAVISDSPTWFEFPFRFRMAPRRRCHTP